MPQEITQLLAAMGRGDQQAADKLYDLIYDELRIVAERYMRSQPKDHTLQATALVNEAYVRLVEQKEATWQNRAHYLGVAAKAMRSVLVDHARRKRSAKRGGSRIAAPFEDGERLGAEPPVDIAGLDEALKSFGELYPRKAKIVELRFFGGLSVEEAARLLDISTPTVKRDWRMAKAWLRRELEGSESDVE